MTTDKNPRSRVGLRFRGGTAVALLPLAVFLAGVTWLGLSGAPDERGFWPILLAALTVGTAAARDRNRYVEAVLAGMSRPIVMLMVAAWMLAGVLASVLTAGGFVQALVRTAEVSGLSGGALVGAAFVISALVSTATGTSLGTLLLCAPVLYPAGVAQGAGPVWLIGAILGGATFGDNVSPVSDTTIASASSQDAEVGAVVRSRLKYALPAGALALAAYVILGASGGSPISPALVSSETGLGALVLGLGPVVAFILLLRREHLVTALMAGSAVSIAVALSTSWLSPSDLLRIDADAFGARGVILEGMERGVGISIFTILLMGLVGGFEATGLLERWIEALRSRVSTPAQAERRIVGATSLAVLLTTHSVVAILAVGELARRLGQSAGVAADRRANLMDLTVCTYPFLLPFFIPTVLAANLTASGEGAGVPSVSAFQAGLANLHSWGLLAILVLAVGLGYGRGRPEP